MLHMPELTELELLINTTDDMLALLDRQLIYRVVNNSYSFVFGKPRDYFPGKSMAELFSHDPDHYRIVLAPILQQCLAGETVHFERWVPIPGFGDQYLDIRYFPLRDAAGAVDGIIVLGRNRTEVMRSIEAIKHSEALLKRTEGIAHLGGWSVDVATNVFQWTDEMYAIHEVDRDFSITLDNINAFIPAMYLEDLRLDFEHALRGEPGEELFELKTPAGKAKWVRSLSFPVVENGRVVRVEGILQDITELKDAQSGLGKALQALDNHKKVLDQHANLATTDSQGHLTFINDKFLEISGYRRDELLGQPLGLLMTPINTPAFHRELWSALRAGQTWQGDICIRNKAGNPYWIHSTIVPFSDEQGKVEEIIVVSTDINELKRTEETLRRAQKMDAIGQLSGGIAHDFNNLLSIVVGNLELLEEDLAGKPDALARLGNARNAAMRGSALTRRLLNFSLQAPIPGKALDLNEVLRGTEVLISRSLTARVTVEMRLDENIGLVEVSERDFEDAIINLALNASDAMPEGGKLTFATRNLVLRQPEYLNDTLIPAGAYVEITVTDTGCGMTPDIMGKIFEPYFTTKTSDKGSGLGLAMVYGFVQRSKGWILVESTPGIGSSFRLLLPKSEQRVKAPLPSPTPAELPAAAGHETILLVDDELEILNLNNAILSGKGYKVLCSNSGDEAIKVIEQGTQIDLLFTDVVMPGRLNGFELAEAALKLQPRLKVLFTTGYARVLGDEAKKRWGGNILQKPFRSVDMTRKVREVLDTGN
jgi:PAS domain S-box-containing protein